MYINFLEPVPEELTKIEYRLNSERNVTEELGEISDLNIFVGANNSGKSRLIRALLKKRTFLLSDRTDLKPKIEKVKTSINKIREAIDQNYHGFTIPILETGIAFDKERIVNDSHKMLIEKVLDEKKEFNFKFNDFLNSFDAKLELSIIGEKFNGPLQIKEEIIIAETLISFSELGYYDRKIKNLHNVDENLIGFIARKKSLFTDSVQALKELYEYTITWVEPNTIYIPILRSTIPIFDYSNNRKITEDIFMASIAENYGFAKSPRKQFVEIDKNIAIHTGMNLYLNFLHSYNNYSSERLKFKQFQAFLSEAFFDKQEVEIISIQNGKGNVQEISVKIGDIEHPIHHLGDGIQSIINLMYPLYTAKDNSWVFIEEPEISLHPSLQRLFIEHILHNDVLSKKKLRYFITTHSNHIIDLSLKEDNVSIFTFEKRQTADKKDYFNVNHVPHGCSSILQLLGIKNTSVFLANCTIWVEGITDRIYLQAYLEAYCNAHSKKRFNEDGHYAFFEYSGSNLSHYEFSNKQDKNINAKFLSNKIFLIADKDENKSKKHKAFLAQTGIYFKYNILKVREIENLLSPDFLEELLPKFLPNYKSDTRLPGNKKADIKDAKIGNYILTTFVKKEFHSKYQAIKVKSGTLDSSYKLKLANLVRDKILWDDMSNEAQKLTKSIYQFISDHNK